MYSDDPEWLLKCLTERERDTMAKLDRHYEHISGSSPSSTRNLYYFLGDSYDYSRTWSAISNQIPTFRKNGGFMLHRQSLQPMTGADRLAELRAVFGVLLHRCMAIARSEKQAQVCFLVGHALFHVGVCALDSVSCLLAWGLRRFSFPGSLTGR